MNLPKHRREWLLSVALGQALLVSLPVNAAAGGSDSRPDGQDNGPALSESAIRDIHGKSHRLFEDESTKAVVLAFNSIGCPISRLYTPRLQRIHERFSPRGVRVFGINASPQDDVPELRAFANEFELTFPVLKDFKQKVADRLGAERTTEVFVFDATRRLRYRGRVDDQYAISDRSVGTKKDRSEAHFLTDALEAILSAREVAVNETPALGCVIGRVTKGDSVSSATFYADVEPILQRRCQTCHRRGEIGPFELMTYDDAAGWAGMIREVVLNRRMPPWHADPRYGEFSNDRSLTSEELQTLVAWIDGGTPAGNAADRPEPVAHTKGWLIGEPDVVFEMSEPFDVPAEGAIDYQYATIETNLPEDRWIQAAEVRAGNRSVVHHILVFAVDPQAPRQWRRETLGGRRGYFALMVPGTRPTVYPDGMAKRLPAGAKLIFQIHYTPTGTPQSDRSRVGFRFAKNPVHSEVQTNSAFNEEFLLIPPKAEHHRIGASHRFRRDARLLSLLPHMHLRGSAFEYELHHPAQAQVSTGPAWDRLSVDTMNRVDFEPDTNTLTFLGDMSDRVFAELTAAFDSEADRKAIEAMRASCRSEILLSVPAYDFGWQNTYRFKTPKFVPAGSVIECIGHFNNAPSNPALTREMWSQTVRWGPQTWDEMLIGYFDFVYADKVDAPGKNEPAASD